MKSYVVTVKNINDYSVASKLYAVASECCSCKVNSNLPEVSFTFKNKSDKIFFERMIRSLSIFSNYEIYN